MNKTFICLSYWNMSLSFIVMVASQLTYGLLNNLNEAGSLPEINDKAQCWHSAHQYCLHEQRTILSAWDIHCKVTVKAQVEWLAFLGRRWHSTSGRNLCQLSCNVTCILTSLESVFCLSQPLHVNFVPGEAICVFDRGVWTLARAGEVVLWRQLFEAWRCTVHGATCCLPLTRPSGPARCFAGSRECRCKLPAKTKLDRSLGQARHLRKKRALFVVFCKWISVFLIVLSILCFFL